MVRTAFASIVFAMLAASHPAAAAPKTREIWISPMPRSNVEPTVEPLLSERDPNALAEVTSSVQLWDLTSETQASLTVEPIKQSDHIYRLLPSQPLTIGHVYGVRVSDGSPYKGLGAQGELARFHVGPRPRVERMRLSGRSLLLWFTEPMEEGSVEGALSLTNTATGERITFAGVMIYPTHGAFEASAPIDATALHRLRIAASVRAQSGAPFDGALGESPAPADLVLDLRPEDLAGEAESSLQITCCADTGWWDAARQVGVDTPERCIATRVSAWYERPPTGGCAYGATPTAAPPWSMLIALVGLLALRRRRNLRRFGGRS